MKSMKYKQEEREKRERERCENSRFLVSGSELSTFFFGSYQQQTTHHQQPFLLGTLLDDSLIPFRSFSCIVRFRRGFVFCK